MKKKLVMLMGVLLLVMSCGELTEGPQMSVDPGSSPEIEGKTRTVIITTSSPGNGLGKSNAITESNITLSYNSSMVDVEEGYITLNSLTISPEEYPGQSAEYNSAKSDNISFDYSTMDYTNGSASNSYTLTQYDHVVFDHSQDAYEDALIGQMVKTGVKKLPALGDMSLEEIVNHFVEEGFEVNILNPALLELTITKMMPLGHENSFVLNYNMQAGKMLKSKMYRNGVQVSEHNFDSNGNSKSRSSFFKNGRKLTTSTSQN